MDEQKATRILGQIDLADKYLAATTHFVKTSHAKTWQGKIKCKYCTVEGYACAVGGDVSWDWWTQKHGSKCKKMDYWLYKNQPTYVTPVIMAGSNTNWTFTTSSNTGYYIQRAF